MRKKQIGSTTRYILFALCFAMVGFGGHLLVRQQNNTLPQDRLIPDPDAARLSAVEPLAVGDLRPAFTLPDNAGESRSISEWDGDVILLNFWASWCAPCVREIPELARIADDYRAEGVSVIGIALDTPHNVQKFLAEHASESIYPMLIANADGSNLMARFGNARGHLPYSVLLDREGKLVRTLLGEQNYDAIVTLLQEAM